MRPRLRSLPRIAVAIAAAVIVLPAQLHAQDAGEGQDAEAGTSEKGIFTGAEIDQGVGKVFDAIVLRPLGLAGLAVGAVLFVPAAALSAADRDAFDECVDLFLRIPAENVFTRPLGDF